MKINLGSFEGKVYRKKVNFSKAVLWKDRQISLNTETTRRIKEFGVETVIFEDGKKNERWTASVPELRAVMVVRTVGQEQQVYFPISIFKVSQIRPTIGSEGLTVASALKESVVKDEPTDTQLKLMS